MNIALVIAYVLIIVAFVAVIAAFGAIVAVALKVKNDAVKNAKRLYVKPVQSAKNLATAGKGFVQQEQVRVKHAIGIVKSTSKVVVTTVKETKEAVDTVRDVDWEPILGMAQSGMQFAAAASKLARSASTQGSDR